MTTIAIIALLMFGACAFALAGAREQWEKDNDQEN